MYNICPNSFWIKSYDTWGLQPSVPGLREKILVGTHLKKILSETYKRAPGLVLGVCVCMRTTGFNSS